MQHFILSFIRSNYPFRKPSKSNSIFYALGDALMREIKPKHSRIILDSGAIILTLKVFFDSEKANSAQEINLSLKTLFIYFLLPLD
ncbi:unnamed protein product [Blepharisma stoltei]|uniref:Uncharacterized protein n=1 Tax=Blepharisma stoltei TaxID=1481888 RepID=A0AAU9KE54_9CILI|nr:unnamed protein product [Blepharisma stoltei]